MAQHILMFPYPAQGHTLPLLDLAHYLLRTTKDITITIITTPKNHPTISPLLSLHPQPSLHLLTLPFPPHPLLPPGSENVKDLGNSSNNIIISALSFLSDPIFLWFRSHPNPPTALLSDFFLGWTVDLARRLNIPRFGFFSSGALLVCATEYLWSDVEGFKGKDFVEFVGFPNPVSFKEEHLPSLFRKYDGSDPDWKVVRNAMLANSQSFGYVVNTFDAFEGEYLRFLKRLLGHDRVFAVGPVSLLNPEQSCRANPNPDLLPDVFQFLDECPDDSVLYVCFGSQKLLRNDQMEALANGLEMSSIRFVWVVKMVSNQEVDGYGLVPAGFENRVKGRGIVIRGWAPQVTLLSHQAIGGFLSHCGWNSVLEGLVGRAVILGWPMEADQFVNAKLLVEELGVSVRVCEGADTVPNPAELGRVIREVMSGENTGVRLRAKELMDKASSAVCEGGSSLRDLGSLVQELYKLQAK